MKRKNKHSGFTMVEFIVYTAMFALVVMFLIQLLLGVLSANARGKSREAVITNALLAVTRIDFEIRHAETVYDPTSDFVSSMGQLSLVRSFNLPANEVETYVDIYVSDDKRLCIKDEVSGIVCVTSNEVEVVGLDFNRIQPSAGPDGVQTIVTLEYKTSDTDNRAQFSIQSSAHIRNYD